MTAGEMKALPDSAAALLLDEGLSRPLSSLASAAAAAARAARPFAPALARLLRRAGVFDRCDVVEEAEGAAAGDAKANGGGDPKAVEVEACERAKPTESDEWCAEPGKEGKEDGTAMPLDEDGV